MADAMVSQLGDACYAVSQTSDCSLEDNGFDSKHENEHRSTHLQDQSKKEKLVVRIGCRFGLDADLCFRLLLRRGSLGLDDGVR